MLYVYDKDRRKLGVLENATNVTENKRLNQMYFMNFELPLNDSKNSLCTPYGFVRETETGHLYRILPGDITSDELGTVQYECEHAISTLADTILFGWHEVGNLGVYTKDSINYILKNQTNWKLGKCEFNNQFQYGWEQENLLSALFSIATPINDPYMWTFDTITYPWTVNLVKLPSSSGHSKDVAMFRKNMLHLSARPERDSLCTRIYPLGYGEGVNQLTIKSVNNDIPYIQSPPEIIEKYGIIEKVWTDRRYEDVNSLFETAKKILSELQEPILSYDISVSETTLDVGDVVRVIDDQTGTDFKTNVVAVNINHSNNDIGLTIANKTSDIAQSISNLADRQRIETTYAQGATQIYAQTLQANASKDGGAELNFYIPSEMRMVNKVLVKIKTESFRAYSKATDNDGGTFTTTSYEYGGIATTGVETYQWGKGHNHGLPNNTNIFDANGNWVASFVESGDHTHTVQLGGHDHNVSIGKHNHEITAGIYRFGYPSSFDLYCNNKFIATFKTNSEELDITNYLLNDDKMITRGTWHTVKVVPNDLAYISIDLYLQGFIQSRGGLTV